MRRVVGGILCVLGLAACQEDVSLPITLSVTALESGLRPPGQPVPFLVEVDFQHDRPLQNIRVHVEGLVTETIVLESRFWAADLSRLVEVDIPLEDVTGEIRVWASARVDEVPLTSDTVTVEIGDVSPPRVQLSLPPVEITPGEPVVLGFSAVDNSGLVGLEVIFGGAWTHRISIPVGGEATLHRSLTVTVPIDRPLGEDVTIAIVGRDVRGHADTARGVSRLVDRVAPFAALTPEGARFVMRWFETPVTIALHFGAYLSGDTVRIRAQVQDRVGLSYILVYDRRAGTRDSIPAAGLSAEFQVTTRPLTAGDEVRDWIVVEAHDRGGNVGRDSIPYGVYAARIPSMAQWSQFIGGGTLTPDGTRYYHASGTVVNVYAFNPLRIERQFQLPVSVNDLDLTPDGTGLVAAGSNGIVTGPSNPDNGSYTLAPLPTPGDNPREIAVTANGVLGIAASRGEFSNIARMAVTLGDGASDLQVGGDDARVERPASQAYVLFGTGIVVGSGRSSGPALPPGDIGFNSSGSLVLVGDVLYDSDWNPTDLLPGRTFAASALSPDGQTAWLGNPNTPEVLVVRTSDGVIIDRLLLPFMPLASSLSPGIFRMSATGTRLVVRGSGVGLFVTVP